MVKKFDLDGFSIGEFKSPIGGAHSSRKIDDSHLLFEIITAGEVFGKGKDETKLFGPGSIFKHSKGDYTIYKSEKTGYYHCLTLSFNTVPDYPWLDTFAWNDLASLNHFAQNTLLDFHQNRIEKEVLLEYTLSTLQYHCSLHKHSIQHNEVSPQTQIAIAYIHKYYAQPIQLNEISKEVELSTSHLHVLFRKDTGISPHQYLMSHRMKVACYKLVTSTTPINLLAEESGFPNVENFCRAFKKNFQITPNQYRKKHLIL